MQIENMWRTSPALMVTTGLMLVAFVMAVAGLGLDWRVITGAPAWMKPAKFGISTAIYAATMAWLLGYIDVWPRAMSWAGGIIAVVLVIEVVVIDIQAARGTTSHFNTSTPLNAVLFGVMGTAILTLWLASVVVLAALFRQPFADPAWGWTLRLAMLITVLGSGMGAMMVRPTPEQMASHQSGAPVTANGSHTVGAPDGGPGVPVMGWSREHGDLRVPHFLGLHAIQLLPLLFWFGRIRSVEMACVAAAGYLAVFGILLRQALQGQPVLAPERSSLAALLLLAGTAVMVLISGRRA